MTSFPLTLRPVAGSYSSYFTDYVVRNQPESGKTVSRDKWGRDRLVVEASFRNRSDKSSLLMDFCRANRVGTFYFFDFIARNVADENIGTGNGATTAFTVPARLLQTRTVKKAGVTQVEGVDYTYSEGTGTNGESRILFTVAPAAAAAITITYKGERRFLCEFTSYSRENASGWDQTDVRISLQEAF